MPEKTTFYTNLLLDLHFLPIFLGFAFFGRLLFPSQPLLPGGQFDQRGGRNHRQRPGILIVFPPHTDAFPQQGYFYISQMSKHHTSYLSPTPPMGYVEKNLSCGKFQISKQTDLEKSEISSNVEKSEIYPVLLKNQFYCA